MSPNSAQKSLLTFFFQSLTTGPDLGCSVLQGYCCFVQGPKPPTLLTSELPKCTSHLPQPRSSSPCWSKTSISSCPGTPDPLMVPGTYLPFFSQHSMLQPSPCFLCHHTLYCGISETKIQTVFPEMLVLYLHCMHTGVEDIPSPNSPATKIGQAVTGEQDALCLVLCCKKFLWQSLRLMH